MPSGKSRVSGIAFRVAAHTVTAAVLAFSLAGSVLALEPSLYPAAQSPAAPSAQASPAIAPGWAPQPGTAAYSAAESHVTARPSAMQSPVVNQAPTRCCDGASAPNHYVSPQALSAGERDYYHTTDGSFLDPSNWAVMVFKSRHALEVYYKGRRFKTFRAVFGRSRDHGTKLYEGDRRTPEGVYLISGKHPSARWHWFLTLDYPNATDRLRYAALRDEDITPAVRHSRSIREGGSIGIHGTDEPLLNAGEINWTTGCISVDNRDIAELHRLLPIGTVVIIDP